MLNCFIKTSHFRSFFFDEKQNGLSHRKNKKTSKLKTTIAMKTINVRIGWELLLFILIVLTLSSYQQIITLEWKALVFPAIIFALILGLCFSIKYTIDKEFLYIKNSIFGTTKIDIKEIHKIEKTWNLLSAPAPSIMGRIEIYYKDDSIVISPRDFDELKNELLRINPNITVKE